MHIRRSYWLWLAGSMLVLTSAVAAEGGKPAVTKKWVVPRTEYGHPDLQGLWTNATITPLERPLQYGDRSRLTDEEAAAIERREAQVVARAALPTDLEQNLPRVGGGVGTYNDFWFDRGSRVAKVNGEKRSSLIIDPKNGRMPPLRA